MKYPIEQFNKLVRILEELNKYIDNLQKVNYSHLHFLCYQQVNQGQTHNRFVLVDGDLYRQHTAEKMGLGYTTLFATDDKFELYPNDTNDNYIETAMKRALKLI